MLTFEMKKVKTLSMPVLVEGIDQGQLKFKFVIESGGVDYGFPAERGGDNVKFIIPPLEGVIKTIGEGIYKAKLEVSALTEGDRGFFMQPWAEEIRVKQSVSVEVAPMAEDIKEEELPLEKKVKLKITSIFTEEDSDPSVEEECDGSGDNKKEKDKSKKNSKLRNKFN